MSSIPRSPRTTRLYTPALLAVGLISALLSTPAVPAADFFVFVLQDENDSLCSGNPLDCSLREAILQANLDPNHDTIYLPPGTLTLSIENFDDIGAVGDLDILYDTTIVGPGAAVTTIDGAGVDRVFHVVEASTVVDIEHVTIRGGSSASGGGGILNRGTLTMTGCILRDNHSVSSGGGIHNGGQLTLSGTTVSDNLSDSRGGGVSHQSLGALFIEGSTIAHNEAVDGGGGLSINLAALAAGNTVVTIDSSTLSDNQAVSGAGVYLTSAAPATLATLDIKNSTISGNVATGSGGGAFLDQTATLEHVTVADNSAAIFSAIVSNGTLTLKGTIIDGDCGGAITSVGGNVESPGDTCGFDQVSDRPGEADPGLLPLAGYGGPTRTHALSDVSPARGIATTCPDLDQRGADRIPPPPPFLIFCDSGAYEYGTQAPGMWIFADGFESGTTGAW